jgi:hypothetical protein
MRQQNAKNLRAKKSSSFDGTQIAPILKAEVRIDLCGTE